MFETYSLHVWSTSLWGTDYGNMHKLTDYGNMHKFTTDDRDAMRWLILRLQDAGVNLSDSNIIVDTRTHETSVFPISEF